MNTKESYEHFNLIRTNPMYVQDLRIRQLELEQEPARGCAEPPKPQPAPTIYPNYEQKQIDYLKVQLNRMSNRLMGLEDKKRNETLPF